MAIDYTRSEIDVVIDLIRQDNQNRTLTSSQVTFGTPSVYTPIPGVDRNTLMVGTAVAGRGYEGSQSFYYNRVRLVDFVDPESMSLEFTITDEVNLSDLLPAINERLNINLTASKIIDKPLPDLSAHLSANIELKVTFDSMVYLGSLILEVQPNLIPLSAYLPVTELNGLTYEPGV
ncbi:hypothetical protein D3C85_249410 [compost metagenome]